MASFLIADDSDEKIIMLTHYLKVAGWTGKTLVAKTCAEAYDFIDKEKDIACAFVDYYIPEEYGPAIIRRLKSAHPDSHVALVSSSDSAKNAAEAKEAGAEAVLCTSYQSDFIERQILDLLEAWKDR